MASVIINYSSNERAFIRSLLAECLKFSDDIVVSYGSHFYDGVPEDMFHIQSLKDEFQNIVQFVEYSVNLGVEKNARGVEHRPTAYWHNLARWTGANALKGSHEWVFVIDADEIPEGHLVKDWLQSTRLDPKCCYKNACYWYFKKPEYQAATLEDSILLIRKQYLLNEDIVFGDQERDHIIARSGCQLNRMTKNDQGKVMWHHFSWVRTRQGLTRKVKTWAHANDLYHKDRVDVNKLISTIFADDNVNDIVHGYTYRRVDNQFFILI
jgi:hypothetical protein